MNSEFSLFDNWPFILKLNSGFLVLFIGSSIAFVIAIYILRYFMNIRQKKRENLENVLLDFITNYLFEDTFDKKTELIKLKKTYLQREFNHKIAIKQILMFNENLKGNCIKKLRDIFIILGLEEYMKKGLKSNDWEQKARSLYVLSQLNIKISDPLIDNLIIDTKIEVRQQAILYLINTSEKDRLEFLNKIESPLTLWQQIHIENRLKNATDGQIPDFSKWLHHDMETVVEFSIRMLSEFNQIENIPALLPLIHHEKENIRKVVIDSLYKMEYSELIPTLISIFPNETNEIKHQILKIIKSSGSHKQLLSLKSKNASEYNNYDHYFDSIDQDFESELLVD